MFAGEVDPRSRMLNPSSRAIHLMNSLNPTERRCCRSAGKTPIAVLGWSVFPKIRLKTLGAIAHHCMSLLPDRQYFVSPGDFGPKLKRDASEGVPFLSFVGR